MYACRAPEQVDADCGLRGTHTDVWGFATCILHLATGQLPYQGLTQMQMVSAMLKGRTPEVPNSLPDWLQQALRQALTFDTAARPSVALLHKVHQQLCRHPLFTSLGLQACSQSCIFCTSILYMGHDYTCTGGGHMLQTLTNPTLSSNVGFASDCVKVLRVGHSCSQSGALIM